MTKADKKRFRCIEEEAEHVLIKVKKHSKNIFANDEDKWETFGDFIRGYRWKVQMSQYEHTNGMITFSICIWDRKADGSGRTVATAAFNALAEWCKQRQRARRQEIKGEKRQ